METIIDYQNYTSFDLTLLNRVMLPDDTSKIYFHGYDNVINANYYNSYNNYIE